MMNQGDFSVRIAENFYIKNMFMSYLLNLNLKNLSTRNQEVVIFGRSHGPAFQSFSTKPL